MKVILDGETINTPLATFLTTLETTALKTVRGEVKGPKGRLDFSKGSILRLGVKSVLCPVALDLLRGLYDVYALELPKHQKGDDIIEYLVINLMAIARHIEKGATIYARTAIGEDSVRYVEEFSSSSGYKPIAETNAESS